MFLYSCKFPLKDGALGNPIDVSVPGVPKDKLIVSCDNGVVKKLAVVGKFSQKPGKSKISVSALIDGKRRNMGFFRI